MLPIYLKDQDFAPPDDPIYYLLTRDGLFLVKRTPFFEAAVPAPGIPWLEAQARGVRLLGPPLPAALVLKAASFFKAVYRLHRSEAVALLAWREEAAAYDLIIPHQTVGGGHCDYELKELPEGLRRLGTIHSHAGIEAFHSERDDADERYEDGFHITIGNINQDPTLSCSVVVQGTRAQIPPEAMIQPFPLPWGLTPPEEDWDETITEKITPLPRPIEFGT
jgi:hypothetical protein